MHKFTLFTVILSIVTISIVVDIVVNGYSISQDYVPERSSEVFEASDLSDLQASPEDVKNKIEEGITEEDVEEGTLAVNTEDSGETEEIVDNEPLGASELSFDDKEIINVALLQALGVENGAVKDSAPKPYLQAIEFEESLKNRLKIVNLFDFEEYLGTIYALHFQTEEEAQQFYSDLKAKSIAVEGANIREADVFGDQSFYFNQEGKTKTAFSTVRLGASIYGFEYPHRSHQFFKELNEVLKADADEA